MTNSRIWTAALVVIGDEILSGRTQDKNVAQVATWLNVQGIRLAEVRVVPDVIEERIVAAVNALRAANDYLFTTGGIGPTHDDITVDAIAAALGVSRWWSIPRRARSWSAITRPRRADRGAAADGAGAGGAELIVNRCRARRASAIGNIFILAGVPHIAAGMLDALTGTLEGGRPVVA
jgi:molybdopterin-biosynthesis enzyme MoeA-like protein